MPAGRPTKYKGKETLEKVQDYLDNHLAYGDIVPSHEGLSCHMDIALTTIYRWAQEPGKEKFKDMLGAIKTKQAKLLLNHGLDGSYNSNIVKLMLSKHGWVEQREQTVSVKKKFSDFYDDDEADA